MRIRHAAGMMAVVCTALAFDSAPAVAQWQVQSEDGTETLKFGFLIQPQFETLETANQDAVSRNLFIRRFRFLLGGSLGERWSFFFETDSPNIGKATAGAVAGAKDQGSIFVQDAYVTYTQNRSLMVDAGLILLPHSRNGTQSAATLMAIDYAPYSFVDSGPSGERIGRDYGVQLRGYPLGQHLEYRLAFSQGVRGPDASNPFRVSGRVVYYPFSAESGFFYAGTFQGTKRQLGIGGGFDAQRDSRIYSGDVFFETPVLGAAQGLTVQFNWMHYDGGVLLAAIPRQDAWLIEAGYHLFGHRLTPFVQVHARDFSSTARHDQLVWQIGAAWWLAGHRRSLKVGVGQQREDGGPDRAQVVAQLQVFAF